MKVKKLLPVLALALAATTFAACGDQSVAFGQYWFHDNLTIENNFYEHAEYAVSSKSYESSYCNYTVEYKGTFTTTLEYNATASVYTFATKLDVTTTFTLGGQKSQPLTDTAESKVTFSGKGNTLRPIESTKKMTSHTPLSGNYTSVDECYATVEYEYTTTYADKNTVDGYCNITNSKGETNKITINDTFDFIKDYSFIDNEQLLVAVRAFDTDTSSATLGTYSVFAENTQKVAISFTTADASENFNYHLTTADGTTNDKSKAILCRTAKINLDQQNPGSTQVIKFAKAQKSDKNTDRNLILEITTPLYYGIGEIYYKLKSVSYTK